MAEPEKRKEDLEKKIKEKNAEEQKEEPVSANPLKLLYSPFYNFGLRLGSYFKEIADGIDYQFLRPAYAGGMAGYKAIWPGNESGGKQAAKE